MTFSKLQIYSIKQKYKRQNRKTKIHEKQKPKLKTKCRGKTKDQKASMY